MGKREATNRNSEDENSRFVVSSGAVVVQWAPFSRSLICRRAGGWARGGGGLMTI